MMIYRFLFNKNGFGFLGMIMLLVLVAMSGIFVVVNIHPTMSTRQVKETATKGAWLRKAVTFYKGNHIKLVPPQPPTLDALVTDDGRIAGCTLQNNPADTAVYLTLQGWCGPYIDQVLSQNLGDFKTDGWGQGFQYTQASDTLKSCGHNMTCGDGDDVAF